MADKVNAEIILEPSGESVKLSATRRINLPWPNSYRVAGVSVNAQAIPQIADAPPPDDAQQVQDLTPEELTDMLHEWVYGPDAGVDPRISQMVADLHDIRYPPPPIDDEPPVDEPPTEEPPEEPPVEEPEEPPVDEPPPVAPLSLLIHSGDNQTGPPLKKLPQPIKVQVTRLDGSPATDVHVRFEAVEGSGRMTNVRARDLILADGFARVVKPNAEGLHEAWWELRKEGPQRARASLSTGEYVELTATCETAPPPPSKWAWLIGFIAVAAVAGVVAITAISDDDSQVDVGWTWDRYALHSLIDTFSYRLVQLYPDTAVLRTGETTDTTIVERINRPVFPDSLVLMWTMWSKHDSTLMSKSETFTVYGIPPKPVDSVVIHGPDWEHRLIQLYPDTQVLHAVRAPDGESPTVSVALPPAPDSLVVQWVQWPVGSDSARAHRHTPMTLHGTVQPASGGAG